jgi:hypothetical protein
MERPIRDYPRPELQPDSIPGKDSCNLSLIIWSLFHERN